MFLPGGAVNANDYSVVSNEVEVSLLTGSSSVASGFEIYFFTYSYFKYQI